MHKIELNKAVIERVLKRRGKMHAFETLDAKKTALLAIDMQNWMLDPTLPSAVRTGVDIVDPVNSVATRLRVHGGTVVWVKMIANDEALSSWTVFYDGVVANQREQFFDVLRADGAAGEVYPGMQVDPEDITSVKTRYSCLLSESSDLNNVLRSRGIDTVVIAGAVTNVCCESSARDAMMMNYKTIVLSDGCAAHTDDEHNASLSNLLNMFADVRTSADVVNLIQAS